MDNEPYRILGHDEAADTLATCLKEQHGIVYREFELPDGKRADLFCVTSNGLFSIIEVKTAFKTSMIETSLKKYQRWCHAFVFAVPGLSQDVIGVNLPSSYWATEYAKAGVVGIYPCSYVAFRLPVFSRIGPQAHATLSALVRSRPDRW